MAHAAFESANYGRHAAEIDQNVRKAAARTCMNIAHLLAPNPGVFTGAGTNTYVVGGDRRALVIDPGPVINEHFERIVETIGGRETVGVVVTHTHADHAPLANPLGAELGAPVYGFAPGPDFMPTDLVGEGDRIGVEDEFLEVVYTPGHSDDHICLLLGTNLFSGDHIIGGSTVMIDNLSKYLASLEKLRPMALSKLLPGHGPAMDDPAVVIDYYVSHRRERENEIVLALENGARSVGAVVTDVYRDVPEELHRIAALSVAAHLRKLTDDGEVTFD
ncbi:MAG: MBL fold metallo-hydrolase, partial [Acidimicrobiia bacterium]|nr:MBL fold metallo-hydrolase [Acidimicrobiia bacterium]